MRVQKAPRLELILPKEALALIEKLFTKFLLTKNKKISEWLPSKFGGRTCVKLALWDSGMSIVMKGCQ
jgi:hypothetical protein